MITEGLKHSSRIIVGSADTALAQGSGDMEVLATPRLVALMENAAMLAVASLLDAGSTTVGGAIDVKHLRPSAVGAEVVAIARLTKTEGRKLYFEIEATQEAELIGTASHLRVIVDRARFLANL